MQRHPFRFAAALLAVLTLAGCAGIGKPLETPRVSISNIQVQESKGMETAFLVQLRVTNPNDVDLDIKGVDCDLEINGKPFAYGISNTPVKVPAFGSETVPVTVYSSVLDIIKSLFGLPHREDLSYQVKGKVRMAGGGFMPSTLPFDSQGTVSIKELTSGRKGPS
ncbi:MAG: LEA type 2 family protein [Desulfobacterales bacterium]|jgi:LEA14-like dessication related protein|nr:LEA type 2 family protein [Desulfobacterales bacterium]